MNRFADDTGAKNAVLDSELKAAQAAGRGEQYKREAMEYGFAKSDGKGGIVSADGDSWTRGRASASASGMERDERMVIGGGRVNTTYNPQTGEAFTNFDAGQTSTVGRSVKLNTTSGIDQASIKASGGDIEKALVGKEDGQFNSTMTTKEGLMVAASTAATGDDETQDGSVEAISNVTTSGVVKSTAAALSFIELSSYLASSGKSVMNGKGVLPKTQSADAEGNLLFEDEEGNTVKKDKSGKLFTEDASGNKTAFDAKDKSLKPTMRLQGGVISEGIRATWKGGERLFGGSSFDEPANRPTNESGSEKNNSSNNGFNNKSSHNNSPINDLDNNIIASSQATSNPTQFKEALGNTPSSDIGKAQLFSALEDKRAQVMEADMPPQEKSSQLAKIATAQNELKKENPKINKAGLVGNAKNPGVFSFSEFDQLGLVVDEGKVDFEATGENTRTVLNSELDKQISAFVYLLVLDTFQYNRKNETQGRCYGKDEYG